MEGTTSTNDKWRPQLPITHSEDIMVLTKKKKKKKKNWPKEAALTNINLIKADYLSSIICPTVTTH